MPASFAVPAIGKYTWHDAYNYARVNPGNASVALLLAWPLFLAFMALIVVLTPVVFPGLAIASYVLKATNAPAIEKPKAKPAAAGTGASYAEMYPEVQPKAAQGASAREFPVSFRRRDRARGRRSRPRVAAPAKHVIVRSARLFRRSRADVPFPSSRVLPQPPCRSTRSGSTPSSPPPRST